MLSRETRKQLWRGLVERSAFPRSFQSPAPWWTVIVLIASFLVIVYTLFQKL